MKVEKQQESMDRTTENGRIDRISQAFAQRKAQGGKSLITFLTVGDPDPETTELLVQAMISEGADLVELGIPYSDPIAEGPVIQAANERAMKHGIRLANVFDLAGRIRETTSVPLVLLLYTNMIVQYGPDRFFRDCWAAGIDGAIVPDLPYEEREELQSDAKRHGIALIRMVSPVSEERIRMIADGAEGFLYCVSSLGVTGTRATFETDFEHFFHIIDEVATIPTALGFGITNGAQARAVRQYADGVIVGSAMVSEVARAESLEEAVANVRAFTKSLRQALDD